MKTSFSEGRLAKRLNAPEIYLIAATLFWSIANTSSMIPLKGMFLETIGGFRDIGILWYGSGSLLLSYLLARSLHARWNHNDFPQKVQRLIGAFGAFSLLFMVDVLLSTREPFPFASASPSLWALTPFFIIVLFLDRTAYNKIVMMVAVLLGIQALYSVTGYFVDWYQLAAPGSETRMSSDLYDLDALYPLCLAGAPLCLVLAISSRYQRLRGYCFFACAACEAVLILNNRPFACLAASVSLMYLFMSRCSPLSSSIFWKRVGVGMMVAMITYAICVPIRGEFSGDVDVPVRVERSHLSETSQGMMGSEFYLGSGLATQQGYDEPNGREQNTRLGGFNLIKLNPGSLYVRLIYDFGVVGFVLFLVMVWTFAQFENDLAGGGTVSPQDRWLVSGIHAGLLALLVAGLADAPVFQEGRSCATFLVALLLGISVSIGRDVLPARERVVSRLFGGYGKRLGTIVGSTILVIVLWHITVAAILIKSAMPIVSKSIGKARDVRPRRSEDEVPSRLQDAAVAAEDIHFYQHHGIDWASLHRALRRDIRAAHVAQGGSTLTMQVARYLFLSEQKTASRKLAELYIADYLEKRLTKAQILRLYLHNVDFGMHSPGIDLAAMNFFGKSPGQLTLGETAYLVGNLPKPPANSGEAESDSAEERRLSVLGKMGYCFPERYTDEEREAASLEKPIFVWQRKQQRQQ